MIHVRGIAKEGARSAFRRAAAPFLTNLPIRSWPAVVGSAFGISVPSAVVPYAQPTPRCGSNVNVLFDLLDTVRDVPGAVAECGVYRGGSLVAMALYLRQSGARRTVYGFDSFQGFGETIEDELCLPRSEIDPQMRASGFSDTSAWIVADKARRLGLDEVRLVPGYFERSLALCTQERFCFVHLDCDTYSAYRTCLEFFYPRLSSGAVVVFDEYNDPPWPGCNAAVDEFLRTRPERLREIARDNFVKTFFVRGT